MKREPLPPTRELMRAMEEAATDLYGFAVVSMGGCIWAAEAEILDSLLVALENHWFTNNDFGQLNHLEYREEFFKNLWSRIKGKTVNVKLGVDVPLGHDEMKFYQLPQVVRAALFLRSKMKFNYRELSFILGTDQMVIKTEIETAREFLLGKRLTPIEWSEEGF